MKIEIYPTDTPPIVSLIKKYLAEEHWPLVLRSLRQDPIVWTALTSASLRQQIAESAGPVGDRWSPGNLALMCLDARIDIHMLRSNPTDGIDQDLGRQAKRVLEAFLNGGGAAGYPDGPIQDQPEKTSRLARAGLAALGLRERFIHSGDWSVIAEYPLGKETPAWACALACLYTMVPEPYGFLSQLFAAGKSQTRAQLGLHVLFSNPINHADLVETTLTLMAGLSRTESLRVLYTILPLRPELARELALRVIQHLPSDGDADENHPAGSLRKLMGNAELYSLSGQLHKSIPLLDQAWETSAQIQTRLAEIHARNFLLDGELQVENISSIDAWKPAGEANARSPEHLASQALGLIASGKEIEANSLLAGETSNFHLLYAKARLAISREYRDIPKARQYAKSSLEAGLQAHARGAISDIGNCIPDLAALLLELSLPSEASQAAQKCLEIQPTNPRLHSILGRAYAESGRIREAVTAIELAVLLEPKSIELRYQLAETLEAHGDYTGALQERTTILERVEVPSALELRALANCALHTGEHQLAADVCQQALQLDSGDGLARALLGRARFELGHPDKALEDARQATQLSPHHPTPWLTLASLQERLDDHAKALETLRAATHAAPDSFEIHLALGKAYRRNQSLTLAVAAFERAAELAPENREIALSLGKTLSDLGHNQEAFIVLEKAHNLRPFDPDLAYAYARVVMDMGDFQTALRALVTVIQTKPEDPSPYKDYARALLAVGEAPQDAVEALTIVLTKEPGNLEAQALLADARVALGEYESAHEAYQELLDSPLALEKSWYTRLSLGLAGVSLALNQAEAAIAVLRTALENEEDNPEILRSLADAYLLAGLHDDSLEMARDALRYGADDLETLTWFAGLAVHLNAQAEALSALERAVELAPKRTDLLVLLGHTRLKTGDTQGAWETFNLLFNIEGPVLADLRSAAQGLLELDDPETAVQILQRGLVDGAAADLDLLIDISQAQKKAGDREGALETLDKAISLMNDQPDLHLDKANLLIELDRPQAAAACLQHAINLSPNDQSILREGVEIMRRSGKIEAALELAERSLAIQPADLGARYQVADLARTLLQPEYAQRILREGWPLPHTEQAGLSLRSPSNSRTETRAEDLPYFNLYAELCLSSDDEISTAEALTQALQLDAQHPRTIAIQSNLNARKGDYLPAIELFETLCNNLGLDREEHSMPTNKAIDPATVLSIAETGLQLGRWEIAVRLLEGVAADRPNEPFANLSLARALVLRAEDERLCAALGVVNHAPGELALSEGAVQAFNHAIQAARRGLGETHDSFHIRFWQIRGQGAFQPDALAAQKLGALPADPEVTAARIAVLRSMGDIQSATEAARAFPGNSSVQLQLALALIRTAPDAAQSAAQSAANRAPGNPFVQAVLSQAAAENRDIITALQAIQEALTIWPDEPRWHALAARLFVDPGVRNGEHNLSTAIAHLEHATRLEPASPQHFIQLGGCLLAAGESQKATQALRIACKHDPDNPEASRLLAVAYFESGELAEAAVCADTAISLAPQNIAGPILRARIALEAGLPQEALVRSRAALQIDPQDSEALYLEAKSLSALNRPTEALGAIERALAKSKNPLPLLIERVQLIRRVQGQDAALSALRELNAGYPDDPVVFALLSRALADTNQSDEAIFAAQQALRKGGESLSELEQSELHYLLGRLLRRTGQRDQAIHHLTESIQRNPINLEPFLELGRTHIERREYNAALQIFQKGISVSPEDHRAYYQAGLALKEGKDYMRAEKMLRRAAELSPNDLSIHRLLGAVVALNIVHNREATVDA